MEYLPLGRIAALMPEFEMKDLPLGRTLIMIIIIINYKCKIKCLFIINFEIKMVEFRDVIVSSLFPRHLSMAYTMPIVLLFQ